MSGSENRRHARKPFRSILEVSEPEGVVSGVGHLRDVSDSGCSAETTLKLKVDQEVQLSLYSKDTKDSVEVLATVVWQKDSGGKKTYGLRFLPLTESEIKRLRELFED